MSNTTLKLLIKLMVEAERSVEEEEMQDVKRRVDEFSAAGAAVGCLTPQNRFKTKTFKKKH